MANPNQVFGWDGVIGRASLTVANDNQHTLGFTVPIMVASVTVYPPAALDNAANWGFQSLHPEGWQNATPTWVDTKYFEASTGAAKSLSGNAAGVAITFSGILLPGGVLRFVLTAPQTTDKTFYLFFSQVQR